MAQWTLILRVKEHHLSLEAHKLEKPLVLPVLSKYFRQSRSTPATSMGPCSGTLGVTRCSSCSGAGTLV